VDLDFKRSARGGGAECGEQNERLHEPSLQAEAAPRRAGMTSGGAA
jgi:hypothetical protein